MPDYLKTLGEIATAAASIITIFTVVSLVAAGITYVLRLPARIRTYFFYRPKYIIIPTPDEIAKYCAPAFDTNRPTTAEIHEEWAGQWRRYYRLSDRMRKSRAVVLFVAIAAIHTIFFWRLIFLGMITDDATEPRGFIAISAALVTMVLLMAIFLVFYVPYANKTLSPEKRLNLVYVFAHLSRWF